MKKILLVLTIVFTSLFVAAQTWNLKGNSGTSPDSNFIGTTDVQPLLFRVNSFRAGQIHPTNSNTAFGRGSLPLSTAGNNNTAIGANTLFYNGSGYYNTALGSGALFNNTQGYYNTAVGTFSQMNTTYGDFNTSTGAYALYSNNTGVWNTADGVKALYSNTLGNGNTALGEEAMYSNISGGGNVGIGFLSLGGNTSGGGNVCVGDQAMRTNSTGDFNTAVGKTAMFNSNGFANVAVGKDAMWGCTTGRYNTALGSFSLYRTNISNYNTCVGYNAGDSYNMGWNNTILGANCDVNAADLYNCIAIGQGVICTASSQARIGNSATNSIGGYVGWSNISDGRYKKDIKENVKGLDFIMKLQPVTYHLDVSGLSKKLDEVHGEEIDEFTQKAIKEKEKIVFSGFIAQDVEKAAKEASYDFSGVDKPQDKDDLYGLRYAEFVVPLVKATQEQQQMIQEQGEMIRELIKQNSGLQKRIEALEKNMGIKQAPADAESLMVWPNPSNGKLFITIAADQNSKAIIKIADAKGVLIKREQMQLVTGNNQLSVDMKGIINGIYYVSAEWNDGQIKKTAQVMKQ